MIMSDDPDAWKDFQRDERAKEFRVVGTTATEDKRARAVAEEQPLKDGGGFVSLSAALLAFLNR